MNCLTDVLSLVHRAVFILLDAAILLPFYILLAFFLPQQTFMSKLDIPI